MDELKVVEGYMPFKGYKTWYRIVGENDLGRLPLLTIHGGPGNTHWYLRSLDELARKYHRPGHLLYQIGCGYSKRRATQTCGAPSCSRRSSTSCAATWALSTCTCWARAGAACWSCSTPRTARAAWRPWWWQARRPDMDLWLAEAIRLRSYLPREMEQALAPGRRGRRLRPPRGQGRERRVLSPPRGRRARGRATPRSGASPSPTRWETRSTTRCRAMSEFVVTGQAQPLERRGQAGRHLHPHARDERHGRRVHPAHRQADCRRHPGCGVGRCSRARTWFTSSASRSTTPRSRSSWSATSRRAGQDMTKGFPKVSDASGNPFCEPVPCPVATPRRHAGVVEAGPRPRAARRRRG